MAGVLLLQTPVCAAGRRLCVRDGFAWDLDSRRGDLGIPLSCRLDRNDRCTVTIFYVCCDGAVAAAPLLTRCSHGAGALPYYGRR